MDNVNPPPGQAPDDESSTQPFRVTPGWPGGAEGYGPPQWNPGGPGAQPRGGRGTGPGAGPGIGPGARQRRGKRRRAVRWAGGIAAVALLAAGGTVAGLHLAGGSSAAPANSASAAALNGALSSPAGTASGGNGTGAGCRLAATSATAGSQARARHCRRALLLRRLVRGMYGEVSFRSASGTVTLAFERGTIESASGGHLVVRAASGTTWTWDLASNSVIRSGGKKLQASALTSGSRVFVAGKVSGSARDARLVIVRAAQGGSPRKSSSQAPASSSAA